MLNSNIGEPLISINRAKFNFGKEYLLHSIRPHCRGITDFRPRSGHAIQIHEGTGVISLNWLDLKLPHYIMIFLIPVLLSPVFVPPISAQVSETANQGTEMLPAAYLSDIDQPAYYPGHSRDPLTMNEENQSYLPAWYSMITNLPGDMTTFATESFQAKKIPLYVGIAGLTVGLMTIDNRVWKKERTWYDHNSAFHNFTNDMVWTGDGRFQIGIAGIFAAYGLAFNDHRAVRTASEIAEAFLASGAVDQLIKHISGRQRPADATRPGGDWTFFPNPIAYTIHVPQYDAFPSGHITTVTAVLTVIAENYPELTWFRPFSYVMVGAVSMSLDAYGYHWWSDIPLGVFLGYTFGEIASHPFTYNLQSGLSHRPTQLVLQPVMLNDGVGVSLNLSF